MSPRTDVSAVEKMTPKDEVSYPFETKASGLPLASKVILVVAESVGDRLNGDALGLTVRLSSSETARKVMFCVEKLLRAALTMLTETRAVAGIPKRGVLTKRVLLSTQTTCGESTTSWGLARFEKRTIIFKGLTMPSTPAVLASLGLWKLEPVMVTYEPPTINPELG
jgi:hypothetical protein